jgi:uncharacterized protein with HEPN domain
MSARESREYVEEILGYLTDIESFTEGMDIGSLPKDNKALNAILRSFDVIAEEVRKTPKVVREQYPLIPWKDLAGMRKRVTGENSSIDSNALYALLKVTIPFIRTMVEMAIK